MWVPAWSEPWHLWRARATFHTYQIRAERFIVLNACRYIGCCFFMEWKNSMSRSPRWDLCGAADSDLRVWAAFWLITRHMNLREVVGTLGFAVHAIEDINGQRELFFNLDKLTSCEFFMWLYGGILLLFLFATHSHIAWKYRIGTWIKLELLAWKNLFREIILLWNWLKQRND
jgi:hypothetical protein